jgi:hypothetical protein
MIYHRYPLRSLIWDYCRTGAGLLIALVPLLIGKPGSVFSVLLVVLALLFLGYGLRTLRQHLTAYEIRPDGIISHGPFKRFYAWDAISRIHLRYYSTARDKNRRELKHGWLELKITTPAGTLRIDSDVAGFPVILDAVAGAAVERQIDIDETTQENLKAFRGAATVAPSHGGDD